MVYNEKNLASTEASIANGSVKPYWRQLIYIVTEEDHGNHWLDISCSECGKTNRIGIRCPEEGKPCKKCGYIIDFWKFWAAWDAYQVDEQTLRDYWADQ